MIGLSPRSTLFPYTTLFRSLLLVTVTDEEEPDAWYPHQLVGLPVEHVDGRALGTVAGVEHLPAQDRTEEHTSELQSRGQLVCRLLLEKKQRHHTPGLLLYHT